MKRTLRALAVVVTALALISASAVRNQALAKKEKPPKGAPAPAAGAKPEAAKPGDDKPFDEVVKDMTVSKGLFTFYRRVDDNKVLIEILEEPGERVGLSLQPKVITDHEPAGPFGAGRGDPRRS